MLPQKRSQEPDYPPIYQDDGTGWMTSRYASLSVAEMDGLRARAIRAGVRGAALAAFLVLLLHTDCLGSVSAHHKRLAEDAGMATNTARSAIYDLRDLGQLLIVRKGAGRRRPLWHIAGLRGWP